MLYHLFKLALLAYIAATAFSKRCSTNNSITDLWSSSVTFSIPNLENTTFSFKFQTYNISLPRQYDRNTNIQYAFAIKDMVTLTSNLYYFDLLVLKTFQSSLVLNFIYEPYKWTKVSYNYWISFRQDILIGIETYQIRNTTNSSYQLSQNLNIKNPQKSSKYVAMVFLNGIRHEFNDNLNHKLSFAIKSQFIKSTQLILHFKVDKSNSTLKSVTLAYIVYVPQNMAFGSYGGIINDINFKSKKSQNIKYILANANFISMYGISSIITSNLKDSSFTFSSDLSQTFSLNYSIQDWELLQVIEISYIAIGQMPSLLCLKNNVCSQFGQTYIYNNQCITSCPQNSKVVSYIDGGMECQNCPPNMVYSNITSKCICGDGFTLAKNNSCISLPNTSLSHNRAVSNDSLSSADSQTECLKLVNIQQNNKNLYITLDPSSQILSDPDSMDKNYISLIFPNNTASANSYYCSLSETEMTNYNCLLLFTTGVPTNAFNIEAQCEIKLRDGTTKECSLNIPYKSSKSN